MKMTSSRVIRGTRAKIILYICAIVIITGIIACYNNTLSQLDDVRRASENCHKHEENLSTQLQGITEYKQRLENSLKSEKADHQNTKTLLENKLKEEKNKCELESDQSQVKLNSLQQHFKLLQTDCDDYKEECSKTKQSQQEEINTLQSKLSELQEELKTVKASKESLKSEYLELQSLKEKLEQRVKDFEGNDDDHQNTINKLTKENNELKRQVEEMKMMNIQETLIEPKIPGQISSEKTVVSPSAYQVNRGALKPPDTNGQNVVEPGENQMHAFLAKPNNEGGVKSSSSTSTLKSALKPSQASFDNVPPLRQPTVTPETLLKNKGGPLILNDILKLPEGVVPAPEKKEIQNEQPEIENNRYKNVKNSGNVEQVGDKVAVDLDKENGAHEEFDNPMAQNVPEIGFGENDPVKFADKQDKKLNHGHQDKNINKEDQELQNDVQLEENEEDDDADGYDDPAARLKDPAVRN